MTPKDPKQQDTTGQASQNDSPLYGHDEGGCWGWLFLAGALPVAMTLAPWWWGWL